MDLDCSLRNWEKSGIVIIVVVISKKKSIDNRRVGNVTYSLILLIKKSNSEVAHKSKTFLNNSLAFA